MSKTKEPTNVKYNKDTLELINQLTGINTKLLIEKEEIKEVEGEKREPKKIKIDGKNTDTTIAYKFEAPVEHFNFDGDNVAFYDYSQFFELIDVLETPLILQSETDKFLIKKNKTKITYYISDPDAVGSGFSEINFEDPEFNFCITEDDIKNLRKMINLISAENVNISINKEGQVTVKLFSGEKDNTYETTFKAEENENELEEEFSVTTSKDIWEKAPEGAYDIQVKSEGIIRFNYLDNSEISLDIFAAEIEEED